MKNSLDKEAILARLGGSQQLFENICASFMKLLPGQLAVIGDAVSNRDAETLSRAVHRLKGSVAYFDSGSVSTTISELEALTKRPEFDETRARFLFERMAGQMQELIEDLQALRAPN
ncbi:unnamed protein product [Phaeothamnion confervicola]